MHGCEVCLAENGEEDLILFREEKFYLRIFDVMIRKKGWFFIKHKKLKTFICKISLIASAYINKPINMKIYFCLKLRICLIILCAFLMFPLSAQVPSIPWVKKIQGGTTPAYAAAMVTDAAGNLYTAILFHQILSIDTHTITSSSPGTDICILKTDPQGNIIWQKIITGGITKVARGMACDSQGNLYLSGFFDGNAHFGTTVLVSVSQDGFLTKLDSDGNFKWAQKMGGNYPDAANSVVCDSFGNVYTCGHFSGYAGFNSTTLQSAGMSDVFVMKTNSTDGSLIWVKQLGGPNIENIPTMTCDLAGRLYISGSFSVSTVIGTTTLNSVGGKDIFLASLESVNGSILWAERIGGPGDQWPSVMVADMNGNVYTAGWFNGTISYGSSTLVCNGSTNLFCLKNNGATGNPSFEISFPGIGQCSVECNAITYNQKKGIYFTGSFEGNIAIGSNTLSSLGSRDIFLMEMDTLGNINWADRKGGIGFDGGYALATDLAGNIYTGGFFSDVFPYGNAMLGMPGLNGGYMARWGTLVVTGLSAYEKSSSYKNSLKVFPNPTLGLLNIHSDVSQVGNIRITSVLGKTVLEFKQEESLKSIEVIDWEAGVYFINFVDTQGLLQSQKFIKE